MVYTEHSKLSKVTFILVQSSISFGYNCTVVTIMQQQLLPLLYSSYTHQVVKIVNCSQGAPSSQHN